jgi:hypothetical protein
MRIERVVLAAALAAAAAAICLAALDRMEPELTRGHRVFALQPLGRQAALSQIIDVQQDGLAGLRFEAERADGRTAAEVRLVELLPSGEERQVRVAATASDGECCTVRFAPLPDSGGRRYRVELRPAPAGEAAPLAGLRARAAVGTGGLVINGNAQASNLVLRGLGAPLATPEGEPRVSLRVLLTLLAAADALVIAAGYLLTASASSPRPA